MQLRRPKYGWSNLYVFTVYKEARIVKDVKWLAVKYFQSIWTQLPVNKLIHKTVSSIHLIANIKILIINGYHIMAICNSQEESKKPAT